MSQDRRLEFTQCRRRFQTQLFRDRGSELAVGLKGFGLPAVKGGSANFVKAFEGLIGAHGGVVRTGVEVERITVRGDRAVGVVAQYLANLPDSSFQSHIKVN